MSEAVVVQNVTKKFSSQYRPSSRWIPAAGLPGFSRTGRAQPALSALDEVTFQARAGEIFGVTGPHGSGKTTLVHLLGGLLPPDNGTIRVFGYDVVRQPAQARAMTNRISGQASFFQRLSALENLAYSSNQSGLSRTQACQWAVELLAQLGAQPHEMKLPLVAVSRSMVQKVALVNALLSRPRLLLLDEPFHGMDPSDRQRARQAPADVERTGRHHHLIRHTRPRRSAFLLRPARPDGKWPHPWRRMARSSGSAEKRPDLPAWPDGERL